MARFTPKDKLQVVTAYLSGTHSYRTIAKRWKVNQAAVIKWVALYRQHGEDGLRKRYTNYPPTFKLDVLKFMNETGASLQETAAVFNIAAPSTISVWRNQLEVEGLDALFPKKKGRPSMKEKPKKPVPGKDSKESLQEEVERLRMENAYLKKLNALVKEKEASQRNSKRK
jgi:transposase-like protein